MFSAMPRVRCVASLAVSVVALAVASAPALASHGGGGSGGGGGGGTAPPPATPSVTLSPSSLTFGPQAVGTTTAPQIVTLTNTGTTSIFINGDRVVGADAGEFGGNDDECLALFIAPGASCTMSLAFTPGATGTRTATLDVLDSVGTSNALVTQVVPLTGTGTSVAGPTPLSVDTTGMTCTSGVCQLGIPGDALVKNFFYASLGVLGQASPPYTWTLVSGALPPGVSVFPNGQIYGTPTAAGTFTFTVKVAGADGRSATQAFSVVIVPQPPPLTKGQQGCQHAPGTTTANLSGPAIAGVTPSGQAVGDQSQLTACGGFTVIKASIRSVNLPNGTPLWVTLGGEPIGRIVLTNGAATMQPWTYTNSLRQQSISIYTTPPTGGDLTQFPVLGGPFV